LRKVQGGRNHNVDVFCLSETEKITVRNLINEVQKFFLFSSSLMLACQLVIGLRDRLWGTVLCGRWETEKGKQTVKFAGN